MGPEKTLDAVRCRTIADSKSAPDAGSGKIKTGNTRRIDQAVIKQILTRIILIIMLQFIKFTYFCFELQKFADIDV